MGKEKTSNDRRQKRKKEQYTCLESGVLFLFVFSLVLQNKQADFEEEEEES